MLSKGRAGRESLEAKHVVEVIVGNLFSIVLSLYLIKKSSSCYFVFDIRIPFINLK